MKKKTNLIFIAVGVFAVIIVLMLGVKLLTGSKGANFYDLFVATFTNEVGTFKYEIDVRTQEAGTSGVVVLPDPTNLDETEEIKGYQFVEWNNSADIRTQDWRYPNYKITIEGTTTSVEPLTTNFTVNIATEYYNNLFTEVTCFDGVYYLDISSMRDWLISSGDEYLISLGKKLPEGSKYLVIPEEEFFVYSRYAEDGEKELSKSQGLLTTYRRFTNGLKLFKNSVSGTMGTKGMGSNSSVVTLNLQGDDARGILDVVKSVATKSGDFYDSMLSSGSSLYDDTQMTQAKREKDNVIEALHDLAVYLNTCDYDKVNLQMQGTARQYKNGSNNSVIEAVLLASFTGDMRDYTIQVSATKTGGKKDVILPVGSQVAISSFDNPDLFRDTLDNFFDYLNVSLVKTETQLEITPDSIKADALDSFIELVNSVGTADYYLTRNNVNDFIDKYSSGNSFTEGNELVNVTLVRDFLQALGADTKQQWGSEVEEPDEPKVEEERYPVSSCRINDVDFTFSYDESLSDSQLTVVNVEVINRTESDLIMDFTDLSIHDLLSSVYPCNNNVLLRSYDNSFDLDSLATETLIPSHSWNEYKLYFLVDASNGYLDLWYTDIQMCVIAQY